MNTGLVTRRYIQPLCALINALCCSLVCSKAITPSRRVFTRPRDGTSAPVNDTSELGRATLSEQTSDRLHGSSGHRPACGFSAAAWGGRASHVQPPLSFMYKKRLHAPVTQNGEYGDLDTHRRCCWHLGKDGSSS